MVNKKIKSIKIILDTKDIVCYCVGDQYNNDEVEKIELKSSAEKGELSIFLNFKSGEEEIVNIDPARVVYITARYFK